MTWHIMWIVCLADNSRDMSSLIFFEIVQKKKKIFQNVVFVCFEVLRPSQPNGVMSSVVKIL